MDFRNAITELIGSAGEPYDTFIAAFIFILVLTMSLRLVALIIRKLMRL